jgi:predicted aminopeptidase
VKAHWGGNAEYDAWFAQPLNNATLAAVATYTRWLPLLRARLESRGLDGFYADTAALAKLKNDERAERLRGWAAPLSASE